MQRVLCCVFAVSFLASSIAGGKPVRRPLEPEPPPRETRKLDGIYALAYEGTEQSVIRMKIWNQAGNSFLVGIAQPTGNPAIDWHGRGVLEGDRGYYDWEFPDGKVGRTTFTLDKNGAIHGQVRGSGIDWDYVGRRWEKKAAK